MTCDGQGANNLITTPADIDPRHMKNVIASFADGHVDYWKWKVNINYYGRFGRPYTKDEKPDWLRIKECIKQMP